MTEASVTGYWRRSCEARRPRRRRWRWGTCRAKPLPRVGERLRLVDHGGRPHGVVETTRVTIVPLHLVGNDVARDEGEGFTDAAQWRQAHVASWAEVADLVRADAGDPTWQLREAEPVVVHWFRLLEPAAAPTGRPAAPVADRPAAASRSRKMCGARPADPSRTPIPLRRRLDRFAVRPRASDPSPYEVPVAGRATKVNGGPRRRQIGP